MTPVFTLPEAAAQFVARDSLPSVHRVKTNQVSFGVPGQRAKAMFADGRFFLEHAATVRGSAAGLHGAVVATKIQQRATATGRKTFHFDQHA